MKHIIFSNYYEDVYSKECKEGALECILDNRFWADDNGDKMTVIDNYGKEVKVTREELKAIITEEEIERQCEFDNETWWECEKDNLHSVLESGEIWLCIADLGLWNGRHCGYKEVRADDFLYCKYDYMCCYVDEYGNLRKDETHHDGTNSYLYRRRKDGISDYQWDNFLNKIYEGKVSSKDISRYTQRVGDAICDIYGWKIKGRKIA